MQPPKASIILWMVARNLPLGHFHKYTEETAEEMRNVTGLSWGEKKLTETARRIVNGLSQYPVAEQVAREWDLFPSLLRMAITDLCGKASHSGNVSKGISYLDTLLKGKIRRREVEMTERNLVVRGGRVVAERRVINQSVAGAERAFAILSKPSHYDKLSPAEKRRHNEEAARIRRMSK